MQATQDECTVRLAAGATLLLSSRSPQGLRLLRQRASKTSRSERLGTI
jgi:hypothetical protein